jgi:predicted DNA-binding transcriptional regulator YafY
MAQTERLYKLKNWLNTGRCISKAYMLAELEVSESTLKRDLLMLRDRMNTPVVWISEQQGWQLARPHASQGAQYELPGLWFSAEEIHALLTMQQLLSNLDAGGLLGPHIEPLMRRLHDLLGSGAPPTTEVARRIKVNTVGARKIHLPHFQAVGSALLLRQRIVIHYLARGRGTSNEREVSPQRLIHYRDNWYLDAYCHLRGALRSFSVDAIERVQLLGRKAQDIPDAELDAALGAGYGIFAGQQVQWATLRFSAQRARWVAAESWHPDQRGRWDSEGRWLLDLPYADPRELVMDILRHVPEVEVVGPESLRQLICKHLTQGLDAM